jgi:Winged helix-turn helix
MASCPETASTAGPRDTSPAMTLTHPARLRVRPLSTQEHETLLSWLKSNSVSSSLRRRARVILLASYGISAYVISILIPMGRNNVAHWIRRFNQEGLEGLRDRPRPGRPRDRPERPSHGPTDGTIDSVADDTSADKSEALASGGGEGVGAKPSARWAASPTATAVHIGGRSGILTNAEHVDGRSLRFARVLLRRRDRVAEPRLGAGLGAPVGLRWEAGRPPYPRSAPTRTS